MEESLKSFWKQFEMSGADPDTCPPLTLAYIGDAVFELIVRFIIVSKYKLPVGKLHAASSHIVCAEAQSEMIAAIEPELTGQEAAVYRRGRNAKSHTTAKNASVTEYRRATGFEALVGYLFLKEEYSRLIALCEKAIGQRDVSPVRK